MRQTRLNSLTVTLLTWLSAIGLEPISKARNDFSSWLHIHFGTLSEADFACLSAVRAAEPGDGRYRLTTNLADWTLEDDSGAFVTSESQQPAIRAIVDRLIGGKLARVVVSSSPPVSRFQFDNGLTLALIPYPDASDDDELWCFHFCRSKISLEASGRIVFNNFETGEEYRESEFELEFAA